MRIWHISMNDTMLVMFQIHQNKTSNIKVIKDDFWFRTSKQYRSFKMLIASLNQKLNFQKSHFSYRCKAFTTCSLRRRTQIKVNWKQYLLLTLIPLLKWIAFNWIHALIGLSDRSSCFELQNYQRFRLVPALIDIIILWLHVG